LFYVSIDFQGCYNGDVRIVEDNFPQIFWNERWNYICDVKFTENTHGVNLFCKEFGFNSGEIIRKNETDKLTLRPKSYDEHSFLVGSCTLNDTWPHCTGGCNFMELDSGCYNDSNRRGKYVSCGIHESRRFRVRCEGNYTSPISTCYGKIKLINHKIRKFIFICTTYKYITNIIIFLNRNIEKRNNNRASKPNRHKINN